MNQWVLWLALILVMASFALTIIRFILGPQMVDRALCLDLCSYFLMATTYIYASIMDQAILMDVMLVFALITFIATVAYARYLEEYPS